MADSGPAFDIGDAASFVGRTETREAVAHPEPARLLLATLDRDDRPLAAGDPLPLLWHWLYFPPRIRQSRLGEDGHTHDSELLPVARSGGILVAGVTPVGNVISGTAVVTRLDGWTREDATLKAPASL